MKTYAMSDIHGCFKAFATRIEQLSNLGFFEDGCEDRLVLLGDYVDRGSDSLGVVREAMRLQRECPERVVALLGNHDDGFLRWLGAVESDEGNDAASAGGPRGLLGRLASRFKPASGSAPIDRLMMWRMADSGGATMRSFLGLAAYAELENAVDLDDSYAAKAFDRACKRIRTNRSDEVRWLCELRLCYETERHIFVHAGIDESLGGEWSAATPRETMLYSRTTPRGPFLKDVVAGHTPTSTICGDPSFHGVLWDGASHYYLDGMTFLSGVVPVLVYDSEDGGYREFDERGGLKPVKTW